jgi:hypothetical protein
MIRDGKHFFMCFLAIWISSLEKVLFSSVAHCFIGSLIFGEFSFLNSLYVQSYVWCIAGKYFLLVYGWSLQFRDHFFCCAEAFKFLIVPFPILFLSCWAAGVLLKNYLPIPLVSRVFLALYCTKCKVSGLLLRSLIHLDLILAQDERQRSSFSFLQADSHFSQQYLLKRLSFLHHMILAPLSKIWWA